MWGGLGLGPPAPSAEPRAPLGEPPLTWLGTQEVRTSPETCRRRGLCTEAFSSANIFRDRNASQLHLDQRRGKVRPSEQTAKDFLSQVDGSGFYLENTSLGGFL